MTGVQFIRTPVLRLDPGDDVVIAVRQISAGTHLTEEGIECRGDIPAGHKIATHDVATGAPLRRYGQIIGFASTDIQAGDHVHSHNLAFEAFDRDYAIGHDVKPTRAAPGPATFQGIRRANGAVATRNYIGIVSTVNCSASVSKFAAQHFTEERLAEFPNVDGVVSITHSSGCGMDGDGRGLEILRRTIAGYTRHPNFGGVVVIGLGCESNQMGALFATQGLDESDHLTSLVIQSTGGTRKTVAAAVEAVETMLPVVNRVRRETCPASEIVVGLQCGGSDGYSGITANPALGAASDVLVSHGGTVILSETPEVYGAEHLLTRRAVSSHVAEKLIAKTKWWETYTALNGGSMDNNPSPGNKAGGLTTILEKSLGAITKGGTTNLVDVYDYAEPVTERGFVFMDTPGYDPVSITGQVAGGANLITFTTGRGSVYGCKPAPSVKLATNTELFERMPEDMDINCGDIIDGTVTVQQKGQEIFDMWLRVASGDKTLSEELGIGSEEFIPWHQGAVM
ncbi:MAG: altronate dehydratase family protein [Ilumatobacteraceae bacterium]